jgi:DMSO/TMAO reductase YedYZ molybdopterin-dependent catalytic subunit
VKEVTEERTAGSLISSPDITREELQLAVRNHSMPLEALRYEVTPLGLHYLLIHFDIPAVNAADFRLTVGGHVERPLVLTMDDLRARPATTLAVTLECAGNGRARLSPRPMSQPWLGEAVGNAEWTGTPLAPILEEAGMKSGAVDVIFTGLDRGIQGGVDQWYERSLSVVDASRPEVMLVYAINGVPLPPQHGYPLRLIVPGWYGMTHVKWLRSITVSDRPFTGYQQATAYHVRMQKGEDGVPVTRIRPRALMVPPGVPEYMTRRRHVDPGVHFIEGRAWCGTGPVVKVEVSDDGGKRWSPASLEASSSPFAWKRWTFEWDASSPGEYELCARATDDAGRTQPLDANWNAEGVENNAVQRIAVVVGAPRQHQVAAGGDQPLA